MPRGCRRSPALAIPPRRRDSGFGTAFEVNKNGKFTLLHTFTGGTDGKYLYGGLILDPKGRIYGTTINGGTGGYGTVWRITK